MAHEEVSTNDLPLSANLQDITVKHFVLDLSCHMAQQVFEGSVTLWCLPTQTQKATESPGNNQEGCTSLSVTEKGETSQEASSATSVELSRLSYGTESERCGGLSGKIQCMCKDNRTTNACYSHSVSGNIETVVKTVNKMTHTGEIQKSALKTSKDICLNRNCPCGCVHKLQSESDCKTAVVSVMDGEISGAAEKDICAITHCSYPDPALGTIDTLCCHKHPSKINSTATNIPSDIFEHSESDSRSDTGKTVHVQLEDERVSDPTLSQSKPPLLLNRCPSVLNQSAAPQSEPFRMILDSYKLDIHKAEGIYLRGDEKLQFEKHPDKFVQQISEEDSIMVSRQQRCQMQFIVKEHCVHLFVEKVCSPQQFPHAVQIWYRTQPSGPSLKWTRDQDEHPCVFTLGHFLSNRSLFPSQDFTIALPTWQASVTVEAGLTVLLTGDTDPHVILAEDGRKQFSFFTHFPMPSSTFALAIGSWKMENLLYESLHDDEVNVGRPQIRLFFPEELKEKSLSVLSSYLPCCMLETQKMLGIYPFHRLDVLLVPASFDSLGMASPSLLFLSQSVLCADGSMCVRVAHELCHTWFGLIIGPRDWTEEWMTEGFCTYLEDILHARLIQLGEVTEDYLGLRAELHLRVLKAEMDNTDENLQRLRPNKGEGEQQPSGEETRFLKNGMNVEKKFMQVHYLKGYFLLHALEKEVGRVQFLSFLKDYVHRNLCQLVTSQDFLQMFFSTFPHLVHLSVESINRDWLDCPGMPKSLSDALDSNKSIIDKKSALSIHVQQQMMAISKLCHQPQRKRRRGQQHHRQQQQLPVLDQMLTPQVIFLLDGLLDEEKVPCHLLDWLRSSYNSHLDNPEVCHRWCELVIKHKHKKWYTDVEQFLIHHQAMGVYLYGEASISQCPRVLHLARSCFRQLQHDMPESVRDTVSAMLYGT